MASESETCKHIITQGKEGQEGYWCRDCHTKVMDVDLRPCGECANFRQHQPYYASCKTHMMRVVAGMRVTYKISEGTCWQAREGITPQSHNPQQHP